MQAVLNVQFLKILPRKFEWGFFSEVFSFTLLDILFHFVLSGGRNDLNHRFDSAYQC